MEKLILWGVSSTIDNAIEPVRRFAAQGDVEILGICISDNTPLEADKRYGYPQVAPDAPEWKRADCVLVCTKHYSDEDIREVLAAGAEREQLVPCRIVTMEGFSFSRYRDLLKRRISIMSNVCWGGLTYHYFSLPFLSPTINMTFDDSGYISFLEELQHLLVKEPVFEYMKHNAEEDIDYPVFDLEGIKLYMYHWKDREQALTEWKRRSKRVNYDDLLVMMVTYSEEIAERFSNLPFRKKICFVPFRTKLPCCVYIDSGETPLISYVNSFANGIRKYYDPWILLEEGQLVRAQDASDDIKNTDAEKAIQDAAGIIIYGAWAMGTKAYNMIKAVSEEKLLGFAVTSMEGNPDEKYGFPVHSIDEWADILHGRNVPLEQMAVFMALHPQYYGEVRELLTEKGFHNIYMLEELERYYHERRDSSDNR